MIRHVRPPAAFNTPQFRRLFVITGLGTFAQGAIFTTLGWVIVEETGSPVLVSLVITTFLAPQILAGPLGGAAADRFGRALILRAGMAVRVFVTLALGVGVAWDPGAAWLILTLNVAGAVIAGATVPARRALTADVVPKSDLTSAISMEEFGISVGFMAAPFATGILLLTIDAEIVLFGVAVLFALASLLVPAVPKSTSPDSSGSEDKRSKGSGVTSVFVDGLRFAWNNPIVRSLLVIGFVSELLAFNYFTLIPIFATEVFDGGSALQGSLKGTGEAGGVIGVLALAFVGSRLVKTGRWFLIGVVGAHAIAIPLAFATSLPAAFVFLTLLGVAGSIWVVLQSRVIIEAVPQDSRARLLGVQQMTWGAGAIGGVAAGALAEAFSPAAAVAGLAAAGLVLTTVIIVFSGTLRRSRISPAAEDA